MSKAGINRNLPNDAYEAATNANAPSALNPFVTEVDAAVSAASLILYPTTAASVIPTYNHLVNGLADPDYDDPAVDLSTGAITGVAQLIASLASDEGVISGNPGVVNVNTIGNIRRVSGSGTATFYFEVYHRNVLGVETLIGTSNTTYDASSAVYEQFFASALITGITFGPTDRVVTKWYANRVPGASDPTYEIQIGGATPVKITFPVPLSSLPNGHTIEDEGVALIQRPTLNFTGGGVTVTDNLLDNETVVTIPAGSLPSLTELYDWVGDITNNAVERRNQVEPFLTGSAPTVTDDETLGYRRGSMVFDFSQVPARLWMCLDPATGAAVWVTVNNDILNIFRNVTIQSDVGYTWGTNAIAATGINDTIDFVSGTNVTIETDPTLKAVRISATGGGGGGGWTFPSTDVSSGTAGQTASLLTIPVGTGIGHYRNFQGTANDTWATIVPLYNNGVAYDGRNITIDLHWMPFGAPGVGENVEWTVEYYFGRNGTNVYTQTPTSVVTLVDVSARTSQLQYTDTVGTISGLAGDTQLHILIRRNSQGATPDTYAGDCELYSITFR